MHKNHDSITLSGHILIVDDEIANLKLLMELLSHEGYKVRPADHPQLAIDSAFAQTPALILLDVKMPEMDGFEVCRRLMQDERTSEVPVIFISALDEVDDKLRGFEVGGVDYISKPFQEKEVLARVRTHMYMRNMQLNLEEMIAIRTVALAKSNASLEEAQQLARIGSWSWVVETDTVTWSKTLYEITGLDPKKPPPSYEKHPSLYTAESWKRLSQAVTSALDKGQPFDLELDMVRPDGSVRHTSARGSAVKSDDGCVVRLFGTVQDITELKRVTDELARSEAKYRSLVENALVGVFNSTGDGQFTFVNGAMVRLFDFDSADQMIARGSLALWRDPKDRERMMVALQKHGSVTNFRAEFITHTDRHIHVLFSAKQAGNDIVGMVMDITELQEAYTKIEQLQKQLQAESAYLQEEIKLEHNFENIIGQSEELKYVLHRVEMVAPQDSTVILLGETGTGKELIARALHQLSPRSKRPLVKVNCAALPAELIESELFGREKGAFTGATTTQVGRFELANKSTLFLDEIGELPLELQAKLLRVLESGEFERLGSPRALHSDARIITATNRDLEEAVRKKRFREDLWYRLKIFPITIPPLRDRIEDIPLLVDHFVEFFSRKMGKQAAAQKITKSSMQALQSYPWPGNVRELKHVVESALITSEKNRLHFDLPQTARGATRRLKTFEEMEREYILNVLKATNWKIKGKDSASTILGLPPSTLRHRIKKLGLKRP